MRSSHIIRFAAIFFSFSLSASRGWQMWDICVDTGNETEREMMSESPFYYVSVLTAVWWIYSEMQGKKFFLNGPLVLGGAVCSSVLWSHEDGFGPPDPAPVSGVSTIFSNWWVHFQTLADMQTSAICAWTGLADRSEDDWIRISMESLLNRTTGPTFLKLCVLATPSLLPPANARHNSFPTTTRMAKVSIVRGGKRSTSVQSVMEKL